MFANRSHVRYELVKIEASSICCQQFAKCLQTMFFFIHVCLFTPIWVYQHEFAKFRLPQEGGFTPPSYGQKVPTHLNGISQVLSILQFSPLVLLVS